MLELDAAAEDSAGRRLVHHVTQAMQEPIYVHLDCDNEEAKGLLEDTN
jgi:hypothetical protein